MVPQPHDEPPRDGQQEVTMLDSRDAPSESHSETHQSATAEFLARFQRDRSDQVLAKMLADGHDPAVVEDLTARVDRIRGGTTARGVAHLASRRRVDRETAEMEDRALAAAAADDADDHLRDVAAGIRERRASMDREVTEATAQAEEILASNDPHFVSAKAGGLDYDSVRAALAAERAIYRSRFSDTEWAQADAGKCTYQLRPAGWSGGEKFCDDPRDSRSPFMQCTTHDREIKDDNPLAWPADAYEPPEHPYSRGYDDHKAGKEPQSDGQLYLEGRAASAADDARAAERVHPDDTIQRLAEMPLDEALAEVEDARLAGKITDGQRDGVTELLRANADQTAVAERPAHPGSIHVPDGRFETVNGAIITRCQECGQELVFSGSTTGAAGPSMDPADWQPVPKPASPRDATDTAFETTPAAVASNTTVPAGDGATATTAGGTTMSAVTEQMSNTTVEAGNASIRRFVDSGNALAQWCNNAATAHEGLGEHGGLVVRELEAAAEALIARCQELEQNEAAAASMDDQSKALMAQTKEAAAAAAAEAVLLAAEVRENLERVRGGLREGFSSIASMSEATAGHIDQAHSGIEEAVKSSPAAADDMALYKNE
jgi:hypothetical protein